jgi:hypothetical protein
MVSAVGLATEVLVGGALGGKAALQLAEVPAQGCK